jgi:hypothetical protein
MVTAVLEQRNALTAGGIPEAAITDETLTAELTRAVLGYLDVRGPA